MKVKGIPAPAPRVRRLSIAAACLAFFMSISEPAYATSNLQVSVSIPIAGANLEASFPTTLEEQIDPNPSLLELDSVKTVDASSMALISVAARKVELARQADGAREVAREIIAAKYQWSEEQFTCLDQLWIKESHWNYQARNKVTGAHGIPQALPATKMEIIGTDWRTNPVTQITWGLKYIEERYETPCKAWSKFKRSRWY
ncbi:MAG: lytic transglycosylase domain-containing protein [Candidatus Nanopelagicaceae bacterium]|nr:lytic transglycosylase domain-containing protein [Candidatus Nanopelagicaceae bacterium]